jgi:hypothetical protein
MKRFNAKKWVESEIDTTIDMAPQPRTHAAGHVRDLLNEDEYHDTLTDSQVTLALAYVNKAYKEPTIYDND